MNENIKESYFKKLNINIEKYGFQTTYVQEDINTTSFGYSTGIYENFKIPELFISGLPQNLTMELIDNYTEKFKFRKVPINEKIKNLIDRFSVYFIEIESEKLTNQVLSSIKYYKNKKYEYLQLIFPDLNGYFPNETNYNYDQKIYGIFK